MKDVYVFLDSTRIVSQKIQHQIISLYALDQGLNVVFYGAEFMSCEYLHIQLRSYVKGVEYSAFLLYSIYQLYDEKLGFCFELLHDVLAQHKSIYFASQRIRLLSVDDLRRFAYELSAAHYSLLNRSLFKANAAIYRALLQDVFGD